MRLSRIAYSLCSTLLTLTVSLFQGDVVILLFPDTSLYPCLDWIYTPVSTNRCQYRQHHDPCDCTLAHQNHAIGLSPSSKADHPAAFRWLPSEHFSLRHFTLTAQAPILVDGDEGDGGTARRLRSKSALPFGRSPLAVPLGQSALLLGESPIANREPSDLVPPLPPSSPKSHKCPGDIAAYCLAITFGGALWAISERCWARLGSPACEQMLRLLPWVAQHQINLGETFLLT